MPLYRLTLSVLRVVLDALSKPIHYPERIFAFETSDSDEELRLRIQQVRVDHRVPKLHIDLSRTTFCFLFTSLSPLFTSSHL